MNAPTLVNKAWSFCHTLRDDSLGDMDNLPEPDVIATQIVENLEAGLASLRRVLDALPQSGNNES